MTPAQQTVYDNATKTAQAAATMIGGTYTPQTGFSPYVSDAMKPATSPEDQKLLNAGVTQFEIEKMKTQEGLDPMSFQSVIGKIEDKFKSNNQLTSARQLLLKNLFDSPLTPDELKQLPPNIQQLAQSGNRDAMQLQVRVLNDEINGRANTLSQSIKYLGDIYQTSVDNAEKQRKDAIGTVVDFVGQYGSKAPGVLSSLYGPEYLAKLKAMGIDIAQMAAVSTIAQDREARLASTAASETSGSSFSDIMQQAIDAGATPEQAAREAATASENLGVPVSQKLLNSWIEEAKKLKPSPPPITAPTSTPSIEDQHPFLSAGASVQGVIEGIGSFFKGLF